MRHLVESAILLLTPDNMTHLAELYMFYHL